MDYINYCVDNVTSRKMICVFPKQEPRMTREVQTLIKAWDAAYTSGMQLHSRARSALRRSIKLKLKYKQQIETHFSNSTIKLKVKDQVLQLLPSNNTAGFHKHLLSLSILIMCPCMLQNINNNPSA